MPEKTNTIWEECRLMLVVLIIKVMLWVVPASTIDGLELVTAITTWFNRVVERSEKETT